VKSVTKKLYKREKFIRLLSNEVEIKKTEKKYYNIKRTDPALKGLFGSGLGLIVVTGIILKQAPA